ncbi:U3 snoRNP protein [Coprinopsis cinerea okayama7|uniref:U3 snoRNP protein n=1 Tax=Coprinopsis cinerea (strain Okayama-7 / 130 / ATCC MYA-4618 / FGSC 9003) TaxID=240176 RepID=D6RLN8_COPC7|nr:U3 snoRNP protein [Coprinopsis cinerea okayama7\|eukprot:XP_002911676.1 U3 snoRNP protein [Coprinopsis cinerea okayama7\
MERVQFQQEQMLPELKDLVEKNLFTEKEIKQIIKQRTVFESSLVRRVAKKSDYIRYISYEMDLEKLRKKRIERLDLPKSPSTISDYAFVRRQFLIFERALKRFKSDIGLWTQYIQVAKREGARALVGRVTARALQLHPNNPIFYVLAAAHELDNLSPSTARSLLQRGIRVNPDSVELWKEYVKMELGFIESLRRRWEVLGIRAFADGTLKGKEKAVEEDSDPSAFLQGLQDDDDVIMGPPGINQGTNEAEEPEAVEGDEGRRQIMEGAIVKSVIQSAAQALPKVELFLALETVISEFPSPPTLQESLLEYLYDVLGETLPRDPKSMELRTHRWLGRGSKHGIELVDGLRKANEEMLKTIGDSKDEALLESYANFVENWYSRVDDDSLKTYLIASLKGLVQMTKSSPSLLATHICLLMQTPSVSPAKVRRTAQKYTSRVPQSSRVWLERLKAEKVVGTQEGDDTAVLSVWSEARRQVAGSEEDVTPVWLWGIEQLSREDLDGRKRLHEESLRASCHQGVHEVLLMHYVTVLEEACRTPESGLTSDQPHGWRKWLDAVRHMASGYLTTGQVWKRVFEVVAGGNEEEESGGKGTDEKRMVLEEIYGYWRQKDEVGARTAWAKWLLEYGKGIEASKVVAQGRQCLSAEDSAELEKRWMETLGSNTLIVGDN